MGNLFLGIMGNIKRTSASHAFKLPCNEVFDLLTEESWRDLKKALIQKAQDGNAMLFSDYSDTFDITGDFEFMVEEAIP